MANVRPLGASRAAVDLLKEAVSQWQNLIKQSPNSPENKEGLNLAKNRLRALGGA